MRILAVTTMRDEGPFILDWVAYHRSIGVTDFLIFSNDCTDGTEALLDALDAAAVGVTHIPQDVAEGTSPQWQALRAAWHHPLRKACDWAVVCDVDEYIVHHGAASLPDLIAALPAGTDAIAMPWRLFGNNGVLRFEDRPVIEQFTASAEAGMEYPVQATFPKSLFRLKGPFNQFGVHRPKQKSAPGAPVPRWVDGAGAPLPDLFAATQSRLALFGLSTGRSLVECHHYSLRSAESFIVKRARGLPNRSAKSIDLGYWVERNFNTVNNRAALRFADGMGAERAALDARAPALAACHADCVARHRAAFDAAMGEERELRLLMQISMAGASQVLPDAEARRLLTLFYALKQ